MQSAQSASLPLIAALSLASATAVAGWELPSILSANMVLQRDTEAPLWGWDEPGSKVTVAFRGHEVTAPAGADGKWQLRLPTGQAGGPFALRIKGSREVTVDGVLVGEVWVAGGQSNMWWHADKCLNFEREKADADYPLIRIWDANTAPTQGGWGADSAQRSVKAEWKPASPTNLGEFPGVPFFFARELHKTLKVPVGIVHLAVPGQALETFLSPAFVSTHLPLARELQAQLKQPAPSWFYNGMVAPVAPYAMRGFLWWQGEANAARHLQYQALFPGLIEDWRKSWNRHDAPFLFVELANFLTLQSRPVEDDLWPALRDAQVHALALDQVREVSAIDIFGLAEAADNIHPPNKQLIGHRLALASRATVYGEKQLVWSGPRFMSARFDGPQVSLSFDHVAGGLAVRAGEVLKGFALAGADRQFHWAEARLVANTVVLSSAQVPQPVAVRYAWANNPLGTLINREGLPAFPFRTDHWNLGEK